MSSKSRWLIFLVSTPLVIVAAVGGLLSASAPRQNAYPDLAVFDDVTQLIQRAYVEPADMDKVMDGAMFGLADGLDPESAYLSSDEVAAVEAATPLPPADVGITVMRQFYLRVLGVREGSPAARAGLRTDDFIRAIDTRATRDLSALAGTRLLHGTPGSKVTLTVLRGNAAEPHVVELTRELPAVEAVSSRRLATGEAYVRITAFTPGAADRLHQAIDDARHAGSTSAVIDLRGTSIGLADEAITAARLFVKSGTIAVLAGRGGANRTVTTAQAGDGAITLPVAILVSSGTADAAEVFAAALAGNHRADLVGEQTAGLAGVQRLVHLPDGHGLWMTYERYLTVDGQPILEHGLEPAVPVAEPHVDFDEAVPAGDAMLAAALEHLKAKKSA